MRKSIIISENDNRTMLQILDRASFVDPVQRQCLQKLLIEIERASIRSIESMPPTVVRIGSIVDVQTPLGVKDGLELVVPEMADFNRKKISVISPLGSALLGYAEGDSVSWPLRNGTQQIIIKRVKLHEPVSIIRTSKVQQQLNS